jgi:hypothetical protein
VIEVRNALTIFALVLVMIAAGIVGERYAIGTWMLGLLSFAWFTLDAGWEGATIIDFGGGHGFTQADIAGVIGLAVVVSQIVRRRRRRH